MAESVLNATVYLLTRLVSGLYIQHIRLCFVHVSVHNSFSVFVCVFTFLYVRVWSGGEGRTTCHQTALKEENPTT